MIEVIVIDKHWYVQPHFHSYAIKLVESTRERHHKRNNAKGDTHDLAWASELALFIFHLNKLSHVQILNMS